jgi:hypothetical protein
MSTHKPKTIEEWLQQMQEALQQIQQIKEALEEKPDRDDVEIWTSDLEFKMEEVPQDVRLPGSLLGSNGGRPHAPLRQR